MSTLNFPLTRTHLLLPTFSLLVVLAFAPNLPASSLTLLPSGGAVQGTPGQTVEWQFQMQNNSPDWTILSASSIILDHAIGSYLDLISSNFFVIAPGAALPTAILGDLQLLPSVPPALTSLGAITLFFDQFSQDPNSTTFDPASYTGSGSLSQSISVSILEAPVIPTPEPSAAILLLSGVALLYLLARRKCAATPLLALPIVLLCIHAEASAQTSITDVIRNRETSLPASSCHPDSDATVAWGCCGSPGSHGCVTQLQNVCIGASSNSLRIDSYSKAVVCNLPEPSCSPDLIRATSSNTVGNTFFVTSDIHFFRQSFQLNQVRHVREINQFAGGAYSWNRFFGLAVPASDYISPPRAVVVNGDISLDASGGNLGAYRLLFETGTHPESIKYPVFLGLGNHDSYTQADKDGAHRFFDYLTGHMGCGTSMDSGDSGSGNYSWDFEGTHFVQLNTWAGDNKNLYRQSNTGLDWLRANLARTVGNTARPVIVMQHYPMSSIGTDNNAWWSAADYSSFWNVIKDYNVIAMFAGHEHAIARKRAEDYTLPHQNSQGEDKVFENIVTATGGGDGLGDFVVSRVLPNYLDVGHVQWSNASQTPFPLAGFYGGPQATGCRKRINDRFIDISSAVQIATSGSGLSRTVTLARNPNAPAIPGPTAVKVHGLANSSSLVNRLFVDSCSPGGAEPIPSSPYILLADNELQALNAGQPVSIPLNFDSDPAAITVKLIHLTPIKKATPFSVDMLTEALVNQAGYTDPGPQTVTVTGVPNAPIHATVEYSGGATNWLILSTVPPRFDLFGRATITFRLDPNQLSPVSAGTLQANLRIGDGQPMNEYLVGVSLRLKLATFIGVTITPPISAQLPSDRPLLVAKLSYPASAVVSDGLSRPSGKMVLNLVDANGALTPLSESLVNGHEDRICNLPPPDNAYFNYPSNSPILNPNDFCPSYKSGTQADPFTLNLIPGRYNFVVTYSGDSFYAPSSSPTIDYRIGNEPVAITKVSGDNQIANLAAAFSTPVKVRIVDRSNVPAANVDVVFTLPASASQATATFVGAAFYVTVRTDVDGYATAPILNANTVPGSYQLTASVPGKPFTATFQFTNNAFSPSPELTASITSRIGSLASRTWFVEIVNRGGPLNALQIADLTLQQTGGPACVTAPVVTSQLPVNLVALISGGSAVRTIGVNFTGCSPTSRFTVRLNMQGSAGTIAYQTGIVLGNQFP